ncbi:psbP domain-containing protein 5, chloroplastic-like [Rutidosis leptorrhynchoides]|uniref:psbP domain-containing protein 5, chloroplastic-like n=1 Tax=Rutidosis leptorrhynchoides TaxID=125765 RepID=UPI003A9A65C5
MVSTGGSSKIDGDPYWYYEYLVRKSPTKTVQDSNIFRHYLAASVERDGFLYSLNASTLNKQWDMEAMECKKFLKNRSRRLENPLKRYWKRCGNIIYAHWETLQSVIRR